MSNSPKVTLLTGVRHRKSLCRPWMWTTPAGRSSETTTTSQVSWFFFAIHHREESDVGVCLQHVVSLPLSKFKVGATCVTEIKQVELKNSTLWADVLTRFFLRGLGPRRTTT
mmetsp:Transcript_16249/g.65642  ORF Transcript_16249/g.65642 Transcript_16249/m.65642 type:complete len:112 (+) Transcript_16249:1891-2226(+)